MRLLVVVVAVSSAFGYKVYGSYRRGSRMCLDGQSSLLRDSLFPILNQSATEQSQRRRRRAGDFISLGQQFATAAATGFENMATPLCCC